MRRCAGVSINEIWFVMTLKLLEGQDRIIQKGDIERLYQCMDTCMGESNAPTAYICRCTGHVRTLVYFLICF